MASSDQLTFIITKNRLIDLFGSLGMELNDKEAEGKWLSMEEYLNMRLKAANIGHAESERLEIEGDVV